MWMLFWFLAGTPVNMLTGFPEKVDCEFVAGQIDKAFHPKKIACIKMASTPPAPQPN